MKLLIYTAVWRRPEITEICFMGIKRLQNYSPMFHVAPFAVISEESVIPLCEKYGVEWCMHENLPLGAKKNFGLSQLRDKDFDYLIEIGSDNILLNDILNDYKKFDRYDFFGIADAAYINSKDLECRRLQTEAVYGAGRAISKNLLEKMDYKLWSNRNRGMDKNSIMSIYNAGFKYWQIPAHDYPLVVDIKSDVNIWSFNAVGRKGVLYDINEIFSRISEQEVNAIKCLTHASILENLTVG